MDMIYYSLELFSDPAGKQMPMGILLIGLSFKSFRRCITATDKAI
jgi:hypothetical protein